MLRRLWRLFKRLLFLVAVLVIVFGTFVAYLGVTTPEPRASDVWQRLPDLPNPRGEVASAVGSWVGDELCPPGAPCEAAEVQLFVIGGLAGLGRTVDTVDIFDPGTGTWVSGPALPEPRHHPAAVGFSGIVYVTGGSTRATDWAPEADAWQLFANEDRWEEIPDMPEGRMGHQMVAFDGKLYVIGGRGETSNVLIYDAVEQTWSTGAEMPEPRDHLGIALSGFSIYVVGGRDDALSTRVDVYNILKDEWTEGPPLPEPVSAMAIGTLPDGIHVVGGEDPKTVGGGVIDRHFVLRPGDDTWSQAPLPILATHGSAYGVMRGALIVTGGARRQGALSPIGWTGLTQVYQPGLAPSPTPTPTPT